MGAAVRLNGFLKLSPEKVAGGLLAVIVALIALMWTDLTRHIHQMEDKYETSAAAMNDKFHDLEISNLRLSMRVQHHLEQHNGMEDREPDRIIPRSSRRPGRLDHGDAPGP